MSGVQMNAAQLPISHSQRLNSGKPLGTGHYEWLCICIGHLHRG